MVDCNCGGGNGDRPPEKRYGLALKPKSDAKLADERLVRAKMGVSTPSSLFALVGVGGTLFIVGLVAYIVFGL